MTAVIYARYSSAGQQETSIEFQVEDCRQFAARLGYEVVRVFEDRAKSATTDSRPGFLSMIHFCTVEQKVDAVICWKHDRFARNRYDAAVYKSRLSHAGARLLYCRETNSDGADSIIIDSVMEGLAEFYSANLSANVKAGNRKAAEKRWTLGVKVFGLRTAADKTYEINPSEAPLVRSAFELYASGAPITEVIALLGPGWTHNRVASMLRNEKYIGRYKMYGVDDFCIPPIIDRDLFYRVQTRLDGKKHEPNSKKDEYLLSGKVFCGLCGDKYRASSTLKKKTGKRYHWYACRRKSEGCENITIDRDRLDELVVRKLTDLVHSDPMIDQLCAEFLSAQEQNADFLAACESRLRDLQSQRSSLITAITRNPLDSLVDRLASVEQDIEAAQAAVDRERAAFFTEDEVRAFFLEFRNHPDDLRWRMALIRTFLVAVWIYPDRIVIQTTVDESGTALPDGETASVLASGPPCGERFEFTPATPANVNKFKPCIWFVVPLG